MNGLVTVRVAEDVNWHKMYKWCEENCQGKFYSGTDWYMGQIGKKNYIVQFEQQQDAVLFALRWS